MMTEIQTIEDCQKRCNIAYGVKSYVCKTKKLIEELERGWSKRSCVLYWSVYNDLVSKFNIFIFLQINKIFLNRICFSLWEQIIKLQPLKKKTQLYFLTKNYQLKVQTISFQRLHMLFLYLNIFIGIGTWHCWHLAIPNKTASKRNTKN